MKRKLDTNVRIKIMMYTVQSSFSERKFSLKYTRNNMKNMQHRKLRVISLKRT